MNKKKPLPVVVVFAIITTITTIIWVGFEVYRSLTKEPSPSVPAEITAELSPSLDLEALSKLVGRVHLEDSQIRETEIVRLDEVGALETQTQTEPVSTEEDE